MFYNQGAVIGSSTLTSGTATLSGVAVGGGVVVGTNSITAIYQGSVTYHPSLSPAIQQVLTKATTTTSVKASLNPIGVDQSVTYTANVIGQYGGPPSGIVICLDNGSNLTSVRGNLWQFKKKYTTPGTHSIACNYPGDANNFGSTAPTLTEQALYPTVTVVTSSGSPSHVGQPVTFTAMVSSKFGAIPNGELVTFSAGIKVLGTAPLSSGTAVLTTSSLTKGTHAVLGTYAGDTSFKSGHGKVTQVVTP
jgi:hypothetical protein